MALFGKNKKDEKKTDATTSGAPAHRGLGGGRDLSQVLKHARITEKASMQHVESVYTFDVAPGATKREIIAAVRLFYKVTPRKIAIVSIPTKARRSMRTGMRGSSGGGKKAYVYLKKGETIEV